MQVEMASPFDFDGYESQDILAPDSASEDEPRSDFMESEDSGSDLEDEVPSSKRPRALLSSSERHHGHGSKAATKCTPSRDLQSVQARKSIMGRPSPASVLPSDGTLEQTLTNITNTLSKVVKRLDRQESLLTSMEKRISSASTSCSSSSGESKKQKIPLLIRVSFYSIYG